MHQLSRKEIFNEKCSLSAIRVLHSIPKITSCRPNNQHLGQNLASDVRRHLRGIILLLPSFQMVYFNIIQGSIYLEILYELCQYAWYDK